MMMPTIFSTYRILPAIKVTNSEETSPMIINDVANPITMRRGLNLWSFVDPVTIIGITGSTHGDATLVNPATKTNTRDEKFKSIDAVRVG